ncbi:General transcription factor IIH subunit 4 [Tritrichomonas musculus]|uniref:General transcription factor IIH subunit 4 n=1 Tax=Tritrichomonas musculus TaxID=1915356 RepID=A0ABR2JSU7_9EUKA
MSHQEYSNLLQFILSRDENIVIELLRDADACRTFIRLLTPLSQHFLFRMLMIPEPLELSTVRAWAPPGSERSLNQAFSQLQECHFFIVEQLPREIGVRLHPDIRHILLYGNLNKTDDFRYQSHSVKSEFPLQMKPQNSNPQREQGHLTNLEEIPYVPPEVLDDWSASQLDKILYWMLELTDKIDPEMRQLLRDSHLIEIDNKLTKDGHQFVLTDRRSQIWLIVRSYLNSFLQDTSSELISALRFILKLGSLQFTRGYPISMLSDTQQKLLTPFCSLGLIYIDKSNFRNYFFPTRVVLNFFGKEQISQSEGWILIDTNFKITAYTTSPLNVALLKKFSYITYQMPGFTSAYISPVKLREALDQGTSLDDILTFLKLNICTTKGEGKIPPDVEHQLLVWKNQRERITTTPDCVMRTYQSKEMAEAARALAEEMIGFIAIFPLENGQTVVITTEDIEAGYSAALKQIR